MKKLLSLLVLFSFLLTVSVQANTKAKFEPVKEQVKQFDCKADFVLVTAESVSASLFKECYFILKNDGLISGKTSLDHYLFYVQKKKQSVYFYEEKLKNDAIFKDIKSTALNCRSNC
jgi:hypothetical protein